MCLLEGKAWYVAPCKKPILSGATLWRPATCCSVPVGLLLCLQSAECLTAPACPVGVDVFRPAALHAYTVEAVVGNLDGCSALAAAACTLCLYLFGAAISRPIFKKLAPQKAWETSLAQRCYINTVTESVRVHSAAVATRLVAPSIAGDVSIEAMAIA